jgi:hypothetical protein
LEKCRAVGWGKGANDLWGGRFRLLDFGVR